MSAVIVGRDQGALIRAADMGLQGPHHRLGQIRSYLRHPGRSLNQLPAAKGFDAEATAAGAFRSAPRLRVALARVDRAAANWEER